MHYDIKYRIPKSQNGIVIIIIMLMLVQLLLPSINLNSNITDNEKQISSENELTEAQEIALSAVRSTGTDLGLESDWLATAGGSGGYDFVNDVATDSSGNAIVVGSISYNVTLGNIQVSAPSGSSGFIAKLNPFGYWTWAVALDGGSSSIEAIDIDSNDMVYMVGSTYDVVSAGAYTLGAIDDDGLFVGKLNPQGAWVWAESISLTSSATVTDISVDDNGYPAIVGHYYSSLTFGSTTLSSSGGTDIFIAKLNGGGTNWNWAKSFGGVNYDYGNAIDTWEIGANYSGACSSHQNNFVITGEFTDVIDFDSYSFNLERYNSSAYITWVCGNDGDVFDAWSEGVPSSSSTTIASWYLAGHFNTWSLGTAWSVPTGLSSVDSCTGYANGNSWSYLFTYDCNYPNGLTTTSYATSPTVSGSGYSTSDSYTLEFDRLLGIEGNNYDHVNIQVYKNGYWYTLWSNPSTAIDESNLVNQTWTKVQYDVSNYFPGNSAFKVRFGIGTTDGSVSFTGWNIDNVKILQGSNSIPSRSIGWDLASYEVGFSDDVNCVALAGTGSGVLRMDTNWANDLDTGGYDSDVFVTPICTRGGSYGNWNAWGQSVLSEASSVAKVSIDSNYKVTVSGGFSGTADFDGTYLTSSGSWDVFVATIDDFAQSSTSSSFDWDSVIRGGGEGYDRATAHAVTTNGATILGGYFSDESSYGSNQLSSYSSFDGLVTQLSASGSWSWAEQIGGAGGYDSARGVAALSDGSTAIVGGFEGTANFDSTAITSNGGLDGFVAIYEANGTLRHITSFGSDLDEGGVSIVEGASGSLYIMGEMGCYSNIVNILGKAVSCPNQNTSGGEVWFVAKLNSQLQASWVTPFGIDDYGSGELRLVSEYGDGSVLACGSYNYGALRVGNFVDTLDHNANQDLFCARLTSSNGNPMWLATADMDGRYESIYAYDIEIDDQDQAYLTGTFSGTVAFGSASTLASAGEEGTNDIFVASIGDSGAWSWAIAGGGTEFDRGTDIFLDGSGNLNVMGGFTGSAALGNTMLTGNDAYTNYPFIAGVSNTGSWTSASKIDSSDHAWALTSTTITDDLQMVWFIHYGTLTLGSNILDAAFTGGISFSVGMFNQNTGEWEAAETAITPDYNIDIYYQGFDAHGDGRVVVAGAYSGENSPIPGQSAITDGSTNAFLASWSFDADGDGIQNAADACPYGVTGWTSSASTDHDSDGCKDDDIEDPDDDNDGRLDPLDEVVPLWGEDSCPKGELGWTSDQATNDHDSDGCLDDSDEDTDDDNDGITDPLDPAMPLQGEDNCYRGELNWTSDASTDHDSDGCMDDSSEDLDDDNDGIPDPADQQAPVAGEDFCPRGDLGWTSDASSDMDGDGCRDASEDADDDSDGYSDDADSCPNGLVGWTPTAENDHDSDGCEDTTEDPDDDNDTVLDPADDCPTGALGWISNSVTDYDSDGCKDDDSEDLDDDNDVKGDPADSAAPILGEDFCPRGDLGWVSSGETDLDGDGCQDSGEDVDDDGDGRVDSEDRCPSGVTHWDSLDSSLDHDSDGCRDDSSEDADDDNDGLDDTTEVDCPRGYANWWVSDGQSSYTHDLSSDYDSDGCHDEVEDLDDDNDGILDEDDNCHLSKVNDDGTLWISVPENDYDGDGCRDKGEDLDDDGDGVLDIEDGCAKGELEWESTGTNDIDGDGCNDLLEDDDDDGDGTLDNKQFMLTGDGATYTYTIIGSVIGLLILIIILATFAVRRKGDHLDDAYSREQLVEEVRDDLVYSMLQQGMSTEQHQQPQNSQQIAYDTNVANTATENHEENCPRCGGQATWYEQDQWSWCNACNDWLPSEQHTPEAQLDLVQTPSEVVHICTLCQGRMKSGASIVKCGGCGKPYHIHCASRSSTCNLCGTHLG